MADNATKKVSYYNTLIFTIISGLISLILLLLLYFVDKTYMVGIIALEIGIFSVIITCIVQILLNEHMINKLKKSDNVTIKFDTCPDYYSRYQDTNSDTYCSNEFVYQDYNRNYIIKIYPEDETPPAVHDPRSLDVIFTEGKVVPAATEKFYLDDIENRKGKRTNIEKCEPLFKESRDSHMIKGYEKIPWTNIKSKCETYVA